MKKAILFLIALFFSLVSFTQVKYPPKVVVLFVGEKNATFDEGKYPNCTFYYTPGITYERPKSKSKLFDVVAGSAIVMQYKGSPEELYFTDMLGATYFDKNGVISGESKKNFKDVFIKHKRSFTGHYTYKTESYNSLSKSFVKKGNTTKKAKKSPKKPKKLIHYYGRQLPKDFEVENAEGKKFSLQSLVNGNNLTLLYVLHLNPNFDLNKGEESGENKKSIEYIKDVYGTVEGRKTFSTLDFIESKFFGHRVIW